MDDIETFGTPIDPLYAKQKEDVAQMRTALLSCSSTNLSSAYAKVALKNITAMRIYHQIARIIKYLELMDKLEQKLYKCLEYTIDNLDESSMLSFKMLLNAQEQLQKNMIESHKLLQPYMKFEDISVIDLIPNEESQADNITSMIIPADSREKLRNAASLVLNSLSDEESTEVGDDGTAS